jgi:hypothetical protein
MRGVASYQEADGENLRRLHGHLNRRGIVIIPAAISIPG